MAYVIYGSHSEADQKFGSNLMHLKALDDATCRRMKGNVLIYDDRGCIYL
jgi:hypothetical protein